MSRNSNTFRIVEQASLYRTKAKEEIRQNKKKAKNRKRKERVKTDNHTFKQQTLFLHLRKTFPRETIEKDLSKARMWWDIVIPKYKVAIKVVYPNSKVNEEDLIKLGWRVLRISINHIEEGKWDSLVKDIEFVLNKPDWIEERAKELNKDVPKSEVWFLDKISQEWFFSKMKFRQNVPMFGSYIYDLFSEKYRLCIEVDGSIHNLEKQKNKDQLKNEITMSKGFHIIRVKANDEESYQACKLLIEQVIKNFKAKKYKVEQQTEFNNKITELNKSGKLGF